MKKQLLIVALTLGFVATTECKKKTNSYSLAAGTSITVKTKKGTAPIVPAGVTATRASGKNRWTLTNTNPTGTPPVTLTVTGKKK
jgi:hypothetical protein